MFFATAGGVLTVEVFFVSTCFDSLGELSGAHPAPHAIMEKIPRKSGVFFIILGSTSAFNIWDTTSLNFVPSLEENDGFVNNYYT